VELLFPSGGGSLLGALFDSPSSSQSIAAGGHSGVPATAEALEQLLSSLWSGYIEYVIVAEGPVFVQIAGEGEGPYLLEHCPGEDAPMWCVEGGVDGLTACNVLRKVVAGDPNWASGLAWTQLDLSRPKRKKRRDR
jgi:hypothetical protein